jgi:general secretion pathway protein A
MSSDFNADPFTAHAQIDRFFVGRHQEETHAHLNYALAEGEGFTVITGEQGVGKTTACRAFAAGLSPDVVTLAWISGPVRSAGDLLAAIGRQFGIDSSKSDLTSALNAFLMEQRMAGRRVMVFIDDAQKLPVEVLEQVRLVSNLETTREKLIQLVLIGEPGLRDLLDSRALRQMGQRISVCYEIGPLTEEETGGYIRQRMSGPTGEGRPSFNPDAVAVIHGCAHGNPRRINRICAAALNLANRSGAAVVDRDLCKAAAGVPGDRTASLREARPTRARVRAAAGVVLLLGAGLVFLARPRVETGAPAAVVLSLPTQPEASPPVPDAAPDETRMRSRTAVLPSPAEPPNPDDSAPAAPRMTHSVQVGAFRQSENAHQQAARLAARGVKAYILDVKDAQGRQWHTVRVGDFPSRSAAQAHASEFARREQTQTLVRPFGSF